MRRTPPRSEHNPIEMAFSKLKRMIRDAEARTVEGLWRLYSRLVDRFRPDECSNYLAHCGYRYD